jgi:prepilin-type processing-associated H-X9-DG protein
MAISETNGGTMEFTGANAWRHFQIMSNELSTPRILWCPTETDPNRFRGTNFIWLNNSNLSFFVGVDVSNDLNPQMILSGDRNITNGLPIKNGILEVGSNSPAGWTAEMHNKVGNILLADGSVQQVSGAGLRSTIGNTSIATNRLQMPVLGP